MKFYLTFSSVSPLANRWMEIEAPDREAARKLAFREFGSKWSFLYDLEKFEREYFPSGKYGETIVENL